MGLCAYRLLAGWLEESDRERENLQPLNLPSSPTPSPLSTRILLSPAPPPPQVGSSNSSSVYSHAQGLGSVPVDSMAIDPHSPNRLGLFMQVRGGAGVPGCEVVPGCEGGGAVRVEGL